MRKLALTALVLGLTTHAHPAWAGAWLQPPGGIFLKMTGVHSATDTRIACHGEAEPADEFGGDYTENKLFWYGEYGIHPRVTLVGSFAWGDQEITDALVPDYGTRSSGDLRVGARWGLNRDARWPLSLETVVSLPTYPATDPADPVGQREQYLPAGSGTVETEFRLQSGVSLWPLPFYANLEGGYRFRGEPFGDQWLMVAEVGASSSRLFGKFEVRGIWPTGDPCASSSAGAVSIQERNVRMGPEASVRVVGNWWAGLAWTTLLSGRNTLDNDQWLLSVGWVRGRESG